MLSILYVPHNRIGIEILFVMPHNSMVSGADEAKIRASVPGEIP